ncbi:MAG: bifunctional nuclease family protein [Syntrophobacterales bacterium]|nr:MAG: bifunctional nuclease family protein [Syntrophobacterales bacterium]
MMKRGEKMLIEMKVKFLTFDPSSNGFVVFLVDGENKHALPIWIGPFEANAIALKLKKASSHRPLTHDLIRNLIDILDCKISHVVVNDLKENTYYGLIYIEGKKGELVIDTRPSDAIAIALGAEAPIFVEEDVLHRTKNAALAKEGRDLPDSIQEWIENLTPEDFKDKA